MCPKLIAFLRWNRTCLINPLINPGEIINNTEMEKRNIGMMTANTAIRFHRQHPRYRNMAGPVVTGDSLAAGLNPIT